MSNGTGRQPVLHDHVLRWICDICGKRFWHRNSLKRHKLMHSGLKPHKCSKCEYSTVTANQLQKHIIVKHSKKYPHICSRCGKGFLYPALLRTHQSNSRCCEIEADASDHGESRRYHCTDCNKIFTRASNLQSHLLIHTGVKAFLCKQCGREFRHKYHLRRHEHRRHIVNRPFTCGSCKNNFSTQDELNEHELCHPPQRASQVSALRIEYETILASLDASDC